MNEVIVEELQCKKCECVMNHHDSNGVNVYECTKFDCDFRYITRNAEYFKLASVEDIYRDYGDVIKPYVEVEIRHVYIVMVDGEGVAEYDDLTVAQGEVDPDGDWKASSMCPDLFRSTHGFTIYRKQAS